MSSASITGSATNVYISNAILEVRNNSLIANTVYAKSDGVAMQTTGNVLISNSSGGTLGTLVVGRKFVYDDKLAQATLRVSGNVYADNFDISRNSSQGNFLFNDGGVMKGSADLMYISASNAVVINKDLVVNGNVTVTSTQNVIVNDPIIQLGNNISSSAVSTGTLLTRPVGAGEYGNVFAGYVGNGTSKYAIGYTNLSAFETAFTPNANLITAKIYGTLEATANVTGQYLFGNIAYATGLSAVATPNLQEVIAEGSSTNLTVQFTNPIALTATGNVGIGNTAPIAKLQVSGSTLLDGAVYVAPEGSFGGIYFGSPDASLVYSNTGLSSLSSVSNNLTVPGDLVIGNVKLSAKEFNRAGELSFGQKDHVPITNSGISNIAVRGTGLAFQGNVFANTGTYSYLLGEATGYINKNDPEAWQIKDLNNAIGDATGNVSYTFDFSLLYPTNTSNCSGLLSCEPLNISISYLVHSVFNGAASQPNFYTIPTANIAFIAASNDYTSNATLNYLVTGNGHRVAYERGDSYLFIGHTPNRFRTLASYALTNNTAPITSTTTGYTLGLTAPIAYNNADANSRITGQCQDMGIFRNDVNAGTANAFSNLGTYYNKAPNTPCSLTVQYNPLSTPIVVSENYWSYVPGRNSNVSMPATDINGRGYVRINRAGIVADSTYISALDTAYSNISGADSLLYDKYQEGTYTANLLPSVGGGIILDSSFNELSYVKNNRSVVINGRLKVSSVSSASGYISLNLPFTSANLTDVSAAASISVTANDVVDAQSMMFGGTIEENSSFANLYLSNAGVLQSISAEQMKANTMLTFTMTYRAAANAYTTGPFYDGGSVYTFNYIGIDPYVGGCSLMAIRDITSHFRYSSNTAAVINPLENKIGRAMVSCSSKISATFNEMLWRGFNVDRGTRPVYDAYYLMNGFPNKTDCAERFGKFDLGGAQGENEWFTTKNLNFPFTYQTLTDTLSKKSDGFCYKYRTYPQEFTPLISVQIADGEFLAGAGSLLLTDPMGGALPEHPKFKFYHHAGSQHYTPLSTTQLYANILTDSNSYTYEGSLGTGLNMSQGLYYRALYDNLRSNLLSNTQLLNSVYTYPGTLNNTANGVYTLTNSNLVAPNNLFEASLGMPNLNPLGISTNLRYRKKLVVDETVYNTGSVIVSPNQFYNILLPKVDSLGNTLGGIRVPEMDAPLGTYRGVAVTKAKFGNGDLVPIAHTYKVLAATDGQKVSGDPRSSIFALYGTRAVFLAKWNAAVDALYAQGFLTDFHKDIYTKLGLYRASFLNFMPPS